jgi:hypothetical protein
MHTAPFIEGSDSTGHQGNETKKSVEEHPYRIFESSHPVAGLAGKRMAQPRNSSANLVHRVRPQGFLWWFCKEYMEHLQ